MSAFSFVKVMVQTRARAHTAIGTVCYRFGLEATSTLETPVRQWPTEAETRAFDEAEEVRLAAAKTKGEKTQRRRLRPKLIRMDPPRHYDYRGRVGIVASGSAVPAGAAEAWCDPLEWARRIEAADGRRLDSRQCRDDVTGIPLELVRSGFADLAIARQASKLAERRKTPVHWAIHRPHGAGLNWHAHLIYAGRKLSADGEGFEAKRDTAQDKPELVEAHKALWVETCREFGVDLSFDFPGMEIEAEVRKEFTAEHGRAPSLEDEAAIQIEKVRRWREHRMARAPRHELTPKSVRTERAAVAEEEGERLDAIIQGAGGAPLAAQDRLELGRICSTVDELDTRQLLALDRIPVTTAGRLAKYGHAPAAPALVPSYLGAPPQPSAASVRAAPLVPASALPRAEPMPSLRATRPEPAPIGQAPLVPMSAIPGTMPTPAPSHQVAAPRPGAALVIEAPLEPPSALSRPQPLAASRPAPPRPVPAIPVPLASSDMLDRMLPAPSPSHRVEAPRPEAARVVRMELSSSLRRRAGLEDEPPHVVEQVLRPPRPAPRREEVAAPPPGQQRPAAAPEVIHPAPRALSPPQPLAASRPAPPRPVPAMPAPLASLDMLDRMLPAPSPSHRVEAPRPTAARVVHMELSASFWRRAGLEDEPPHVVEQALRPPRPAPRREEVAAPPPGQQRSAAAPEVIHPAPGALSPPQPLAASRPAPPRPVPAMPAPLASSDMLDRMLPAPSPSHRVEAPRPTVARVVRMELSSSLRRRAGLEDEPPHVVEQALRPPRPAPRREEVAAPPPGQQRPAAAPEVIHPAPGALSPPQPLAASRPAPPRPVPAIPVPLASSDMLDRMLPAPSPSHRVEAPRPTAARVVRMELSASFWRRAGLEDELPLVVEQALRPPRPAPRREAVTTPSPEQQRPVVAPEVIHPAPEPPWRRRVRRLLRAVRDWWPWSPKPPSPGRRIKLRLPEQVRPVPGAQRRLAPPQGLSRPRPRSKPILWQTPYGYDFDAVTRTVTINARGRAVEAKVRAMTHAGPQPQELWQLPGRAQTSGKSLKKPKGKGRDDGGIGCLTTSTRPATSAALNSSGSRGWPRGRGMAGDEAKARGCGFGTPSRLAKI